MDREKVRVFAGIVRKNMQPFHEYCKASGVPELEGLVANGHVLSWVENEDRDLSTIKTHRDDLHDFGREMLQFVEGKGALLKTLKALKSVPWTALEQEGEGRPVRLVAWKVFAEAEGNIRQTFKARKTSLKNWIGEVASRNYDAEMIARDLLDGDDGPPALPSHEQFVKETVAMFLSDVGKYKLPEDDWVVVKGGE